MILIVRNSFCSFSSLLLRALEGQLEETRRGLEKLVAVKGELATVKGELVTVKGELATVKGELATIKGELATVKGELASVKGELATVKVAPGEGGSMEVKRELVEQADCLRKVEEETVGMEGEVQRSRKRGNEAAATACPAPKRVDTTLDLKGLFGLSYTLLGHVATMTLKHVHLDGSSGFSFDGIKGLYSLPQLERLELKSSVVSDSTLDGIGRVRTLNLLYLNRTEVTDSGLVHLTCLTALKTLILYKCWKVTCAGMVHGGRMTSLEELYLFGSGVKDEGLRFLTPLSKLKKLILPDTITDAGMEHIQCLTAVEYLDFNNSVATEKGVKLLGSLPCLKHIKAYGDGFQTLLRIILPGVEVVSCLPPGVICGD
ncbi:unnamed protein product [Closterium sp. NIES-65]|nr:unnamed protein product [Closterium sp. NIES-65]